MNTLKPYVTLPIFITFLLLSVFGCSKSNSLKVSNTQCNYLYDPIGINTLKPSFSWKNTSSRQGASQAAYQILEIGRASCRERV